LRVVVISGQVGGCPGNSCPQTFGTEDGDILVQGYKLDAETAANFDLPEGETMVRIPRSLIEETAAKLAGAPQ
jgi:hypothetical protein